MLLGGAAAMLLSRGLIAGRRRLLPGRSIVALAMLRVLSGSRSGQR
ncbi:hypothetical protein [Tessaracoccus sp. G1721]